MDISIILKFLSLISVIVAAFFWTSAQNHSRSGYNDEQTLIAGAIWTQILISVGLIISAEVDDHLNTFVHGYFLVGGFTLPIVTGIVLLVIEFKKWQRNRPSESNGNQSPLDEIERLNVERRSWLDKACLIIAVLCLLSGIFTLVDFLLLMILPEEDRMQWLRDKFMKRI